MTHAQIISQVETSIGAYTSEIEEAKEIITKATPSDLMDYLKWNTEDIMRVAFKLRELQDIRLALDNPKWENAWLENQIERYQDQINMLSINNSSGVGHNMSSLQELKGRVELMKFYTNILR